MRKLKKTTMALFSALTIFSTSVFAAELIAENYVLVYPNANLTTPYSGRYIDVGERFSIVEETENAYRVNYYASSGAPREGWVKKSILNSKPASNNSNPELIAKGYVDVYSDSGLTSKYPGRYIDVGERFSIVQEVGNAYKVNYYASNGDPRVGWVSKSILGGTSSSNNSTPVVNNTPAAPANPIITPVTRPATDTSTTASNSKSELIAKSYVDVYSDSGLTSKYPGRYIDVGERFSIVQEVGNAYKVNYYASNGADRTGWVSKSILGGASSIGTSQTGTNNTVNTGAGSTVNNNELVAKNYVDVYADQNLVSKYAGRYIAAGERFSIVQETGIAYKVNYYASNGDPRVGWVSKSILGEANSSGTSQTGTNNTVNTGSGTTVNNNELVAKNYVDVYADQNLVSQYMGRYIDVGEKFSIVQETIGSYKVNYYASNGAPRTGWVSKSILGGTSASTNNAVLSNPLITQVARPATSGATTSANNELIAQNYVDVYADQNLVSKYTGRFIDVGERFSIIQETIGAYKVNYYASNGAARQGWVKKTILGTTATNTNNNERNTTVPNGLLVNPLITPVGRPTTPASNNTLAVVKNEEQIAKNFEEVYADYGLNNKYVNRYIAVGEKFTIIDERGDAYRVNYYADSGVARQGWVKKTILGDNSATANNSNVTTNSTMPSVNNPIIKPVTRPVQNQVANNVAVNVEQNNKTNLIAKRKVYVCQDSSLKQPNYNTWIDVGEKYDILEEQGNALKVHYYNDNGVDRYGWVDNKINVAESAFEKAAMAVINAKQQKWMWPLDDHYCVTTLYYYYGISKKRTSNYHDGKPEHYCYRHRCDYGHFNGIDISAEIGTKVKVPLDGKVVDVKYSDTGYGNHIVIEHNIDGKKVKTIYAHLSEICVDKENTVKQGDIIAKTGKSGGVEPHFHFEADSVNVWKIYRNYVPFVYFKSTLNAYEYRCEDVDKEVFKEAIEWIQSHGGFR